MSQTITEATWGDPSGQMRVDREAGIIRGVKCLGRESKNGRFYTPKAMEDARGLYDEAPVNLDHPSPDDPGSERKMAEGFGVLRAPRIIEGDVYADLHYIKSHPQAEPIAESAERFPRNFGLSHNAQGTCRRDDDADLLIVESIDRVLSVDVVRRPATNRGIFESEFGKPKRRTVKEIFAAYQDQPSADRLLALLEEEDFSAAGSAIVDVDQDATPEEQYQAALVRFIVKAFNDRSVDINATMARFREILVSEEKLTGQDRGKGTEGETATAQTRESVATEPAAKPDETVDGKLAALQEQLDSQTKRSAFRDLLEQNGLRLVDLTAPQVKILGRTEDAEEFKEAIETLGLHRLEPVTLGDKPRVGSARMTEADGGITLTGAKLDEHIEKERRRDGKRAV